MVGQVCVCVVDDDDEVRESIASFFRSASVSVATFHAAEDILSSDSLMSVDIIISDLHMPGMNGLEFLKEVRRRCLVVPFVIMTAYATAEARVSATELGAYAFLSKPVDPEDLLGLVFYAVPNMH